ncbi:MAG: polyprenyl diphosphate synthase [Patescibacteria group bacterium]
MTSIIYRAIFRLKKFLKGILTFTYQTRLLEAVKKGEIPKHLGVIVDGNRRHAKKLGLPVTDGHKIGKKTLHSFLDWCDELKIPVVTLWLFSTQNYSRSEEEVKTLMNLILEEVERMVNDSEMKAKEIRVKVIGRKELLSDEVRQGLEKLEMSTASRTGRLIQLAISYGGREEIVDAVKGYLEECERNGVSLTEARAGFSEIELAKNLYNATVLDPDFVIRTSGEIRLSGFLLWQSAYSEFYFLDANWPAFRKIDFLRAIRSFQQRSRRFGK